MTSSTIQDLKIPGKIWGKFARKCVPLSMKEEDPDEFNSDIIWAMYMFIVVILFLLLKCTP